ncbi:MAG: alpha/beta fold hydrolase [Candidatus Cyclobacteriaceae bacterium M2_1C_046]
MKKLFCVYIFLLSFNILFAQDLKENELLARQFIGFLENNQFFEAEELLSIEGRQLLSMERLEDLWFDVIRKSGSFEQIEDIEAEDVGGMVIVYAHTIFSSRPLVIQLFFDYDKKINRINFRPVLIEATYALPSYANTDLYREEEMIIEAPEGPLPATLTRPTFVKKFPVVILVHGAAPHDRDEIIGPNKPFKDIAAGLATQGIATFRFEKRRNIDPEYFEEIKSRMTVKDEILDDVEEAIKFARKIKGVDRSKIVVLGHSFGGMLAPRIADENRPVDGVIIMAGNAGPLEDLIRNQINYLSSLDYVPDNRKESQTVIMEQIERLRNMDLTVGSPPDEIILGLPVSYWRDISAYDQLEMAKNIKEPILVMQGGKDYQVPVEEFERWKKALEDQGDVKFILYPLLNHLFVPGEGITEPLDRQVSGHVPEVVVRDIAEWIKLEL